METLPSLQESLFAAPLLKVLNFLLQHPDLSLSDTELVSRVEGVKKSAANMALRRLAALGLVERVPRGAMVLNRLVDSPLVRQLKVMSNLIALDPILQQLKPLCFTVRLFGSRADGSHVADSDYDLLVVTSKEEAVRRLIRKSDSAEQLQVLIKTPAEMLTSECDEPVLWEQVKKGVLLWQRA